MIREKESKTWPLLIYASERATDDAGDIDVVTIPSHLAARLLWRNHRGLANPNDEEGVLAAISMHHSRLLWREVRRQPGSCVELRMTQFGTAKECLAAKVVVT